MGIYKTPVAIILPCYKEEKSLNKVINDIKNNIKEYKDYTIFVIDNNSTDQSAQIAIDNGCTLIKETNQGKGNVIKRAFQDIDSQAYFMIDSDDTYGVKDIDKSISLVLNDKYDMVIGDRLSTTYYTENKRVFHNVGNDLVRLGINKLFKGNVNDILTGYRCFSNRFVKTFPVMSDGFQIETEMTIHLLDNSYRYICQPIDYKDRAIDNPSKLNTFKDGIKVIHMLIKMFKLYKPKKYFNIIAAGLGVISTGFIIPVLYSYYQTGIVERFPTLIVCGFTYIIMILNICMGTILENRRDTDKKQMELKITEVTN